MLAQNIKPLSKEQLFSSLCNISEQCSTGVAIINPHDNTLPILYSNSTFTELTGYSIQELIGQNLNILNGPKTDSKLHNSLQHRLKNFQPIKTRILHYQKDASPFWNEITAHPIKDEHGEIQYILLHFNDVTVPTLYKMLSKLEHEVYQDIEKGGELHDILQLITTQLETYYTRDVYCAISLTQPNQSTFITAVSSLPTKIAHALQNNGIDSYLTTDCSTIFVKNYSNKELSTIHDLVKTLDTPLKFQIHSSWSKPICDSKEDIVGFFTFYFENEPKLKKVDITFLNRLAPVISLAIKYAAQTQQLRQLAFYDSATSLPNLHYFQSELKAWIEQGHIGEVLTIQPGEYSQIVDLYGRQAGDEVLRQIVDRINGFEHAYQHSFVAKFSNSSIIIAYKTNPTNINQYDSCLKQLTIAPYFIQNKELFITLKIGVAHFDSESKVEDSIRKADVALSKARSISGTNIAFFEEDSTVKLRLEMDTLNQLNHGLKNDEFTVQLQPKMNIHTLKIEGFEALCRWYSPVLGAVSPATFIPLAEQAGKIKEIDIQVLTKVLRWLQLRLLQGEKVVPVAVNISPDHFYEESFVTDLMSLIQRFNIPPYLIKLEVTESVELVDLSRAKTILSRLREHGVESSIDDFGVGFSSLSYLQQLPFREIKIDRSFINSLDNPGMYAVVQTIVQLASNLKMKAVAEGIETVDQLENLKNMGCQIGQGYYFYKPMSFDEASLLIQ